MRAFRKDPNKFRVIEKAAISTSDHLIVTTDARLKERLSDRSEVRVLLIDEFLKVYDCD